jgi:hypothetical protein
MLDCAKVAETSYAARKQVPRDQRVKPLSTNGIDPEKCGLVLSCSSSIADIYFSDLDNLLIVCKL